MRPARLLAAVAVVALLAASFIPPSALVRVGERLTGRGGLEVVTVEALGELPWLLRALAALAAAWLVLHPALAAPAGERDRPRAFAPILALAALGTILALLVRALVLREGLISGDEWNNEFTALLFAGGRLWDTPPPHPDFFRFTYFVTQPDRTFSIFPPLWPAVLALGHLLGIGAAINALVAGAAALLVGAWNRGRGAALAATAGLVLSPMFVFTAASSFAGPTVLACLMGTLLCLRRALEAPPARATSWMAAAGVLWGLCFAAHYPTAIGAGLPPLVAAAWWIARAGGGARPAFAALATAAVPLAALGAYHHALHGGAPWVLPASLYEASMIRGAGLDPGTLLRGAAYTALHAVRLLGWTLPLLPFLALLAPRGDKAPAGNRLLVLSIAGLVAFYVFYPSAGGPQYGPRYWFGLLGPLAVLAGQGALRLLATPRGRAYAALLLAGAMALLGVRARLEQARAARENAPFRLAEGARLDHAIVFMKNVNRADHARNAPGWSGPVLFVPDLGDRNAEMRALAPGRAVWLYRRTPDGPELRPEVVVPP
ncbi:MAG: hypothetical protein ABIP29_06355 [Candidatus Eisenbacteria bacterium]